MTVAFDATSQATSGTGELSWAHTPVGTPRGVVVFVETRSNADDVTGVTYGGTAMTEVALSPLNNSFSAINMVHAFFLGASVPTGEQTVVVSVDAATAKQAQAVTVTASGDTEVQDTTVIDSDDASGDITETLSLGGVACFCCEGWHSGIGNPGNVSPLTDWTSRHETDFGSTTCGLYTYDVVDPADVTFGVNHGATGTLSVFGVAIAESAGGEPDPHTVTPPAVLMMGL
jgi:hypothetical protein